MQGNKKWKIQQVQGLYLARAAQVTAGGIHSEGEDAERHVDDDGVDV